MNDDRLKIFADENGNVQLTADQKKAVLDEGKILVSASAGSGKTSTMIKRILLMIAEGENIRRMLVLVYNNAAASEVRDRLHEELFRMACQSAGEVRERFLTALDDMPFASISTIHSFCQSLLKENFEKAALSPMFGVLDEREHDVLKGKALDAVFDRYSIAGDAVFGDLAEVFALGRREDRLRASVCKLQTLIDIQPDRNKFFDEVEKCFTDFDHCLYVTEYAAYCRSAAGGLAKLFEQNIASLASTKLTSYQTAAACELDLLEKICAAPDLKSMIKLACDYERPTLEKRMKLDDYSKQTTDLTKEYFARTTKLTDELKSLNNWDQQIEAHAQNEVYIRKLIQITLDFDEELKKLKAQENVLSFEDLQTRAVALLAEYPELGGRFDCVFVDEYQDVNPTQEKLIEFLVGDNCFMVGDVKQSIYGFRLADPTIFLARQKRYEDGEGEALSFNENFRSKPDILRFVNGIFDVVMTAETADVDYKGTSRFPVGEGENNCVQLHLFTPTKAEQKKPNGLYDITAVPEESEDISASKAEGRFVANTIRSLVGNFIVGDRKLTYGDIAILFRSRSAGVREIAEVLAEEGIPIDDGSVDAGVRPEAELVNMLRVLDNPRQDIPLAGFLLSYFGGYNEQELAQAASFEGECLYDRLLSCILGGGALADKLSATLNMLDGYRLKASFKSVSELMSGIVSDFMYDARLMQKGEAQVWGLRHFISSAADSDASLGGFLEEYAEGRSSDTGGHGGDRVKMLTFHTSKGLEMPVVFVVDVASRFSSGDSREDLLLTGGGLVGLKSFDMKKKTKFDCLSTLVAAKRLKTKQIKEEMRMLYVALTRAKSLLYVLAATSQKGVERFGEENIGVPGCNLDFLSMAAGAGKLTVQAQVHTADSVPSYVIKPANALGAKGSEEVAERIRQAQSFAYPYAEATGLAMKYSVSTLDNLDEQTVRAYDGAADVGNAYHKVMQLIDYGDWSVEAVRAEIERMVAEGLLSEEAAAGVNAQKISRCLSCEVMRKACECEAEGKTHREFPFMMYRPANEVSDAFTSNDCVLVQGVVDLFVDGPEKIILDFKYSSMSDDKLAKKYKKQLYLYKMAVEQAFGAKVDRVLLYSFGSGNLVEL